MIVLYKKYIVLLITIVVIIFMLCVRNFSVSASNQVIISGTSYELTDESNYFVTDSSEDTELCYGKHSLGILHLQGNISQTADYNGFPAYHADNDVSVIYSYDGGFHTGIKGNWNLYDSDEKIVNGIDISKKVKEGAVIVQKSEDAQNWSTESVMTNVFEKKKSGLITFYEVPFNESKKGIYYRISIAYRMGIKSGELRTFLRKSDVYKYSECLEMYEFYIGYDTNPVMIKDVVTGTVVSESSENGFKIDKCGTKCTIKMKKNDELEEEISDKTSVYEPGTYMLTITTNLNKTYQQKIVVTRGLVTEELVPNMYESEKNGKYDNMKITNSPMFGESSLTVLKIGQQSNKKIIQEREGKYHTYGLNAEGVGLYLNLKSPNGWSIIEDVWGKKESQKIDNVWTGTVGTGAIILQKSYDGKYWTDITKDKYANGLYTTDYFTHYGNQGDILLYTPNGRDVQKGIYLKLIYAYQLQENKKAKYRFMETYNIYLCSNDFNAVTFHNLSADDELVQEKIGEDSEIDMTIAKKIETLLSGSCTVSGFSIDTELNPTIKTTVFRNGTPVDTPQNNEFTETGKYDIHMESAVKDTKDITLYVDRQSAEEALKTYFGDGFLNGKRIYSEGEYPVYEGGKTEYHLNAISDDFLPVHGTITNQTTGKTIKISADTSEKNNILNEAGKYTAVLTNRPASVSKAFPGDYRTFTFKFEVIGEGTAPGPVVNQKSLKEYTKSNISDSYPMYYGLTYSSAHKGNITLAFSSWKDARQFSYEYEKGMIEKQGNGTFRYTGSSNHIQKKIYDADDYTDAVNFFAEQAIQELYFDLTDEFTYRTLYNEDFSKIDSLRELKLAKSITIFANGQKEKLCNCNTLPNISKKRYSYLFPGTSGKQKLGYYDFKFVKDKYSCDSAAVIITEADGHEHKIAYNQGVAEQLKHQNCKSGIVTITEETIYGDSVKYQAVYIAENDNTSTIKISYFKNGKKVEQNLTKNDNGTIIHLNKFNIKEVTDELDPYNLITVYDKNRKEKIQFVADNIPKTVWSEMGEYQITVANRLGYSYSFTLSIDKSF